MSDTHSTRPYDSRSLFTAGGRSPAQGVAGVDPAPFDRPPCPLEALELEAGSSAPDTRNARCRAKARTHETTHATSCLLPHHGLGCMVLPRRMRDTWSPCCPSCGVGMLRLGLVRGCLSYVCRWVEGSGAVDLASRLNGRGSWLAVSFERGAYVCVRARGVRWRSVLYSALWRFVQTRRRCCRRCGRARARRVVLVVVGLAVRCAHRLIPRPVTCGCA
jgi:hypothetical protein